MFDPVRPPAPPPLTKPLAASPPRLPVAWQRRWFELLMAARLLRSRRSTHLSLVTTLSVAGIALGVAALIVVLAVNTGFQSAFQDRILASYPHLVVMQRGVDLRDYRLVVARLQATSSVRYAGPATYDDMMLSAAAARAGAVVRGVETETLQNLPPGSIVAGTLDKQGEAPLWREIPAGQGKVRQVEVTRAIASARHVLVLPPAGKVAPPLLLPVLALPGALGGLVIVDAAGCGDPAGAAPQATIWLRQADQAEALRSAPRRSCGLVGSWEALPGIYTLRGLHDGVQRDQTLEVDSGRTGTVVIHGAQATVIAAPPHDLAQTAAAVAAVSSDGSPIQVVGPKGVLAPTGQAWLALAAELPAIAIGEGLSKRLQVKVGDEVRAVSPLRGLDRAGEGSEGSASGRFRVATILRTGFHDHDQRLALVDFHAAQRFLGRGDIARWVEARVDDPILATREIDRYRAALEPSDLGDLMAQSQAVQTKLTELIEKAPPGLDLRPPTDAAAVVDNWGSGLRAVRQLRNRSQGLYRVLDWEEMNRNIFDAARMQKVAMSLFPFIIVLVAALNVVGTQAVVVHERARDIAILRAMGSTRRSVAAVFLVQGLVVGVLGTLLGLLVGALCCWLLQAVGYPLDPQVYLISELPVRAEPQTFLLAGGSAIALAFGAAWLAAQRAATRSPVEALRRLD